MRAGALVRLLLEPIKHSSDTTTECQHAIFLWQLTSQLAVPGRRVLAKEARLLAATLNVMWRLEVMVRIDLSSYSSGGNGGSSY